MSRNRQQTRTLKQAAKQIARMPGVRGRRNGRADAIAQAIRNHIVAGELRPGDQVPPRRELEAMFNTGANTLQHALSQLHEEGFIQSPGTRRGTYVSERLPFMHAYGLVVPYAIPIQSGEPVHLFQRDLYLEAEAMQQEGEVHFHTYQSVRRDSDQGQWQEVVEAIQHHLLAGLILTTPWKTYRPEIAQACQETGLPVIAVMAGPPPKGVTRVHPDLEQWIDLAVGRLADAGRKRIATLNLGEMDQQFNKALQRHGCESQSFWQHEVHTDLPDTARSITHLLMKSDPRPDGLLILDDGIVESALYGLADAKVQPPDDLQVVGLCNYPYQPKAPLPIDWLGYDVREILRKCTSLINQKRSGEQIPTEVVIHPRFADAGNNASRR